MDDLIGSNDCTICMGRRRVCVGISFPPKSTIAVKAEYDPCPGCTPPPHTFHARRTAQILAETRARRVELKGAERLAKHADKDANEVKAVKD